MRVVRSTREADARARKVQPWRSPLRDAPSLTGGVDEVLARASERAASRAIRLALKAATDPAALRPVVEEEAAPAPEYPFGYCVLLFILPVPLRL